MKHFHLNLKFFYGTSCLLLLQFLLIFLQIIVLVNVLLLYIKKNKIILNLDQFFERLQIIL